MDLKSMINFGYQTPINWDLVGFELPGFEIPLSNTPLMNLAKVRRGDFKLSLSGFEREGYAVLSSFCKSREAEVSIRIQPGAHNRRVGLQSDRLFHRRDTISTTKPNKSMSSSSVLRELQRELESKANDLSKLQKDIAKNHQVRKKYTIQLGENELVLKELELLNEDANVFKLIGPVLVKQDLAEANSNVQKRIDYISAELKRLDGTLQDMEEKQNSKKESILKVQQKIQALQAGKAKA